MARVGFIGLGIMGSRMAACLVRAGHELTVHNRTAERARAWAAEHDATAVATPAEVGAASEVVFSTVVDGDDVARVLTGPDGVAAGAQAGTLCVDMSTIAPAQARAVAETLAGAGLRFMDAPVSGSAPRAEDGTLTIMAAGADADFDAVLPVLQAMGELIVHVGPVGDGQAIKVICNAVAAANTNALAQALIAGRAAGVDLDAMVRVMSASSAGSTMVDLKARPMLEHDRTVLFKLAHLRKDVALCLALCQQVGVPFPAAESAADVLETAVADGLGDADFAAIVEVLERRASSRL